jgi:CheY-like chemotaxis protein
MRAPHCRSILAAFSTIRFKKRRKQPVCSPVADSKGLRLDNPATPTVLVAEDEFIISFFLGEILRDAGFSTVLVANAHDAIAALEDSLPSISAVLTDIRMPGEADGWDVARRARELRPSMPVIYMTGDSALHRPGNGVPGSVLLQKPFADAQLISVLTSLLDPAAGGDVCH